MMTDPDSAILDGGHPNRRLKALENASTVSYPHSNAISVTECRPLSSWSAAHDNRRKRMYSPTEYPVIALKILENEDGA